MKVILMLIILSVIPNCVFSNDLELPEPAPSFWAMQKLGLNISPENNLPELKGISLFYKSGRKTLVIYKDDNDEYFGFHVFEATWHNQEKISKSKISIKKIIAVPLINLWVEWLSKATYGSQDINYKLFAYAAAIGPDDRIYEGIFNVGYEAESYTYKMRHLLSRFDTYIMMIELSNESDEEIKDVTNLSRMQIEDVVTKIEKEIIQLLATLRENMDAQGKNVK